MDPWAAAADAMAAGPGGIDALYRFRGQDVDVPLRLVPSIDPGIANGMGATATKMLVPAGAIFEGTPSRGDTITAGLQGWKVESAARALRGWSWELSVTEK